MSSANFTVETDVYGFTKIEINGEDVTRRVTGMRLLAGTGAPTLMVLEIMPEATAISGEGIVQVNTGDTMSLRKLDAEAVLNRAAETYEGDGSYSEHIMKTIIEAISEAESQ